MQKEGEEHVLPQVVERDNERDPLVVDESRARESLERDQLSWTGPTIFIFSRRVSRQDQVGWQL